jgi:uncharacterized protein (DUF58 family)
VASPELLDPITLQKLASLELRARAVVEGVLAGRHRSPHHGVSIEFAEHKEYAPGDEVKHLDWKAYGKFDRYYVKRFEQETELQALLVIDTSGSMGYRGQSDSGLSKLEYVEVLAASLAHLLLRQQDRVGLIAYGGGLDKYLPARARSGQLANVISQLEALSARGTSALDRALDHVSQTTSRRSLVCLFSDLLDVPEAARKLLAGLRARGHDVAVFHVLHADELTFPFSGTTQFESLEDERRLLVDPEDARRGYLDALGAFVERYRRSIREADVQYQLVDASRPPADVLLEFLRHR